MAWRDRMVAKDGRRFPAVIRADAIKTTKGKIVGLIGVHTDITERKKAEKPWPRKRTTRHNSRSIATD